VWKHEAFLNLPYLLNDKQQDGRNTNVCSRNLLLVIITAWIGQVKFRREVNCNIFTNYMQNNNSFKLFKHKAILIHSLSQLHFRSRSKAVRSIHIPWLPQYHRLTVTCLLAGLWRNQEWSAGKGEQFSFTPKHADQSWRPPSILLNKCLGFFPE